MSDAETTTHQRTAILDRAHHTPGMMATSEPEEGTFSTGIWRANARDAHDKETTTILVATEEIARDGMILRMDGVDTSSYMENPVVLWMHGQDPVRGSLPIARCINIMRKPEGLLAQIEWYPDDFSQTIRKMMKDKYLNAASIGWNTPEGGMAFEEINGRRVPVIERSDMTEFSIVAVPADAQALVQSRANGQRADMEGMEEMQRAYKRMYDDVRAYCKQRMDEDEMEGRGMLDMMRMYMEGELDLSARMKDKEQEDEMSERSDTSDPATAGSPSDASDLDATASGSDANDRDEEIVEVYEVESVDDLVATINQIVDRGLGRA